MRRIRRQPDKKEVPVGLFHIIAMIIVGFIVGFIAEVLYPGAQHLGFWKAAIIGIVGSLVGGVIGGLVFRSPDGKFHPAGWFLSIIGALLVLWVYLNYLQ
ncbi:MAG: GlsB/YeaQ/YmgE family stress response membrane protein [Casimicrobiaceae bacterium]